MMVVIRNEESVSLLIIKEALLCVQRYFKSSNHFAAFAVSFAAALSCA